MDLAERLFAIQYLFQANAENMIGRYPRYGELAQHFHTRPQDAHNNARRMTNGAISGVEGLGGVSKRGATSGGGVAAERASGCEDGGVAARGAGGGVEDGVIQNSSAANPPKPSTIAKMP